jgi:predicted histidine transporter YuiF (NhaC family)
MRSWIIAVILCPMCKSNVANAENAAELSQTVDTAVLALLLPTIAIIIGLIRMVLKYRRPQDDEF